MKRAIQLLCLLLAAAMLCSVQTTGIDETATDAAIPHDGRVDLTTPLEGGAVSPGQGNTYYVSQQRGSDLNPGSLEQPCKTIHAAKERMKPGDTVIVESGVYCEKIGAWQAGGTAQNPYTIQAAPGANVTISAYDPVKTEWERYRAGIYRTQIGSYDDIPHALRQKDGAFHNMVEARWPNADAADLLSMPRGIMGAGTDWHTLCSSALPEGDWNGATVYTWTGLSWEQYVAFSRAIRDYQPGKQLTFDHRIPGDENNTESTYKPTQGGWFYLTNALAGLDCEMEYYYEKESGYLYAMLHGGAQPQPDEIWIQTRRYGVELWESSGFQFANLNVLGGFGVYHTDNCVMDNVNVYYSDWFRDSDGYGTMDGKFNSTHLDGSGNLWRNSEIAYTMGNGFLVTGDDNRIENCRIHDVNITGGYNAAVTINPEVRGTVIRRCTLYRSGRFLIYFAYGGEELNSGYPDTLIEYNDIYDGMYLTQDGGAIYSYHRNGAGVVIRYNWVHSILRPGARGIYLDNESRNFEVYRNVVWDIQEGGLVLNTYSENNLIYHNTIVNCGEGIQVWPKTDGSSMKGTQIRNNIVTAKADMIEGALAPTVGVNLFTDTPPLDSYLVPLPGGAAIDAGERLTGYNDGYACAAPDLGAYEAGGRYWIPGAVAVSPTMADIAGEGLQNGYLKLSPGQAMPDGSARHCELLPERAGQVLVRPATGADAVLYHYGERVAQVQIVVRGDVNGDGLVTAGDILLMKRQILGMTELSGAGLSAARLLGNQTVTAGDLLMLKRAILGMVSL